MNRLKPSLIARETPRLDVLVLVGFDFLAKRARFDKLFYVSPHTWHNIPTHGHLDGLLLASMGVFMQCFDSCLSKSWRQKMDGTGTYFWKVSSTHQHQWPFSLARKNLELTLTSLWRSASDGPPSELLEVLSWFSVSGCRLSRQLKPCLCPHGQLTR